MTLTAPSSSLGAKAAEAGLVCPDVVYCYDMEVGADVVPVPGDEEVEEFLLMDVEEVKWAMLGGEFKDNCALVMLDFFVRKGILTQEGEGDFVEIVQRMHRRLPVRIAPPA